MLEEVTGWAKLGLLHKLSRTPLDLPIENSTQKHYNFFFYSWSTHWAILASAGVSGSVLFLYLMTPSKLEKLETLTVCSTHYFFCFTTSALRKVCLWYCCRICILIFQLSEAPSSLKQVKITTLQLYNQKRLRLGHAVKSNTVAG